MTALPSRGRWEIVKMTEPETAEWIESLINYADKDGRSVHLGTPFVRHMMKRDDGVLPAVLSTVTMPIVYADGILLAPDGFWRPTSNGRSRCLKHHQCGIQFEIDDAVRAVLPKAEDCSGDAVREAMHFLCDEWLVDVAADTTGKAVILACALTIIERGILPSRPVFWITAGRHGCGKTTTIMMLLKGLTGLHPSHQAWATSEDERRKALMSQFLQGADYILWDNIARGSRLSCPHIERACTSMFYSDRKLGVSEIATAAASAIHIFTGNNIGPKGDLASRSLIARLATERPDPQNREFVHPDPIMWTEGMRAEIIAALYTVLLGNPTLKEPRDAPGKTRFPLWWRVVGSAIEHAAALYGHPVDFKTMFDDIDAEEEESTDLAGILSSLNDQDLPTEFKAKDVADIVNDHSPFSATLREFLFGAQPPTFKATPTGVGKRLLSHVDNPVRHGDMIYTLKSTKDQRAKNRSFFLTVS